MSSEIVSKAITREELVLLKDPNHRRRLQGLKAVVSAARKLPWEERQAPIKELEPLADDPQPFILWNLAMGLGQIGHPSALPLLEKLSAHEHANVRFRAALAIANIDEERGLETLERLARDEYKIGEHYVVRAYTAQALGQLKSSKAVPILSGLVKDADPVVRWHAAVALGDTGDSHGIEVLAQLMDDPIPFVRAHTAIALGEIGDPRGRPYLEKLAKDSVQRVAQISSKALDLLRLLG